MKRISDFERRLAEIKAQYGDVEISEALHEYGWHEFTDKTFESFIWIARTQIQGQPDTQSIVIGRNE